jgi:hypothetical protein
VEEVEEDFLSGYLNLSFRVLELRRFSETKKRVYSSKKAGRTITVSPLFLCLPVVYLKSATPFIAKASPAKSTTTSTSS